MIERDAYLKLQRIGAVTPDWQQVVEKLRDLGFGVELTLRADLLELRGKPQPVYEAAMASIPAEKTVGTEPKTRNIPSRQHYGEAIIQAIGKALPSSCDDELAELVQDLLNRVKHYRGEPQVVDPDRRDGTASVGALQAAPVEGVTKAPPGQRYAVDENELARRLNQPTNGRPWDVHPESPAGEDIRKGLASETFKREVARVVEERWTISHYDALSCVLDLLKFATDESLI